MQTEKDFQDSDYTESTGSHDLQDQEIRRSEWIKEKKFAESDTDCEPAFRGKRHPHCDNVNAEKEDSELLGFVFAQFLSHDGLKKFGKKGEDAAHGKMKQAHDRDAFEPRWVNELSEEEKKNL